MSFRRIVLREKVIASEDRYDRVCKHQDEKDAFNRDDVRDELAGVAKSNFPDELQTTEWGIVYDQKELAATYRRGDFEHGHQILLV